MRIRVEMLDEMLGTNPGNDEMFEEWVKGKRGEGVEMDGGEDVLGSVEEGMEKMTTVFRRDEGGVLCIPGYMLKGNLKANGDTIRARKKGGKGERSGWESWRSKVDNNVHVRPKVIRLMRDGEELREADGVRVRPLRAKTAQGERVSLARSEYVRAGTYFECEVVIRGMVSEKQVLECLEEGEWYGLGQWRNAGNGTYKFEVL